jgi:hypothetical protein
MESLVSEEWNIKKHTFYHYVSTALAIRTKTVIANTSIILNMRERKNLHNRVFHSLVYAVDSHPIMMKEREGRMTPHFGQDSLMVYTTHKCTLSDHVRRVPVYKNSIQLNKINTKSRIM